MGVGVDTPDDAGSVSYGALADEANTFGGRHDVVFNLPAYIDVVAF